MASKTSSKRDPSPRKHGGRLARRAKSFKEDVMGKLNQIRNNPVGSGVVLSPQRLSPKNKPKELKLQTSKTLPRERKVVTPHKEVEAMLISGEKLLRNALRYFKDVVDKDKLEMLPGCATEVLESVFAINVILQKCLIPEQSSMLMSATNKVYQTLANLIKWSDNLVLCGKDGSNKETVSEIVQSVQEAVRTLIALINEKLQAKALKSNGKRQNHPQTIKIDSNNSCSSPSPIPDIPLTPREREILQQTRFFGEDPVTRRNVTSSTLPSYKLSHSASSDSILNHSSHNYAKYNADGAKERGQVPPKPPLPGFAESNATNLSYSRPASYEDTSNSRSESNLDSERTTPVPGAPPLPPKRRGSSVTPSNTLTTLNDSLSSGQFPFNATTQSVTPPPPPNNSSSVSSYGSESFNDFWNRSDASCRLDWSGNHTPNSVSPASKSPTSSLDSILDRSTEDIVAMPKSASENFFNMGPQIEVIGNNNSSSSVTSVSKSSREYKYSSYSSSSNGTRREMSNYVNQAMSVQMSSMLTQHQFAKMNGNSPPALPVKQRRSTGSFQTHSRAPSQYDNVPDLLLPTLDKYNPDEDFVRLRQRRNKSTPDRNRSLSPQFTVSEYEYKANESSQSTVTDGRMHHSSSSSQVTTASSSIVSCPIHGQSLDSKPPPLPPKKKNIMAYMQMFGKYSCPNESEFYRHSVHTYNLFQAQHQNKSEQRSITMYNSGSWSINASDKDSGFNEHSIGSSSSVNKICEDKPKTPPVLPPKKNRFSTGSLGRPKHRSSPSTPSSPCDSEQKMLMERPVTTPDVELMLRQESISGASNSSDAANETSHLEQLDADNYLVYKKHGEDGPDIRGGSVDALVIHATKSSPKPGQFDFMYQEAFLATYRTFISTKDLVRKLMFRFNKFIFMSDVRQRAARNAFSLLVRVVDDMCVGDVETDVMNMLTEFIFQLVSTGELSLAKALREKVMEKCDARNRAKNSQSTLLPSMGMSTRPATLLEFKAKHLAKQMTLLDAGLFQRIEIPEVLLWAKEQSEELSPNLTKFTEHFNKMSYWVRSRILEQDEAKEREKFVLKFINIMKHLRMLNNFNSYLAILSALDSAPVRRLEWQKDITEGLKEYCQLIDSSSSFRAYRQAVADTEPPCIPYIGLILQDLTFVHIGNSDSLPDSNVNFAKRWQQFNILDNMSRFRRCRYAYKRNDRILLFFNSFDSYLCEESMWQISESIKPRGAKKKLSEQQS